jgi:hypothetical protein
LGSILGSMRLALRHTAGRRANHTDDPTIPSDQGLDPEAAARLRLAGCPPHLGRLSDPDPQTTRPATRRW